MKQKKTIKKSALAPTILIAGGAGFIGSHLAEVLLQKEARVIIIDNFSTGKKSYVNHLLNNPKFALYDADINIGLPPELESTDYVIHLAGLEEYLYDKEDLDLNSLLTNAIGTKNLLDFANKSQAKFLLVSTIDVYEGMMSQLTLEDYFGKTAVQEKRYSLYEAKRYAEALVWEYHVKYEADARIVRLPEVYGPRMSLDSSGTLGRLLKDLIDGRNFVLKGDGTKKESYLYITDAVAGIVKALLTEETEGKIFTLVDKTSISTVNLAFLLKEVADRPVLVSFDSEGSTIPQKEFKPDTYNLSVIKWEPKVSLKQGVISTLEGFGYNINEHSFKNAKFIDSKKQEQQKQPVPEVATPLETKVPQDNLFSLSDIKEPEKLEETEDLKIITGSLLPVQESTPKRSVQKDTYQPQRIYSAYSPQVAPNQHVVVPVRATQPDVAGVVPQDKDAEFKPGYYKHEEPYGDLPKLGFFTQFGLKIKNLKNKRQIRKLQRRIDKLEKEKYGPRTKLSADANLLEHKKEHTGLSIASKITLFLVVFFAFITVFVLYPLFGVYSSTKGAITNLEQAGMHISQFSPSQATIYAQNAHDDLDNSAKYLASLYWVYKLVGKQPEYVSTVKFLSSVENFSKVVYDASLSAEPLSQIWESLKPNSAVNFDIASLDNTKLHISDARNNLQLAIADFQEVNSQLLPEPAKEGSAEYAKLLTQISEGLDLVWSVTVDLPQLLGFNGSKKYLVLFQNNNELRPTGGFIGSYAFLYLEFGKIQELTIDDIYNPDGQIDVRNIKVLPPKPIGDFLSEDRLYIRNANWDPDFPRSATGIKELFYRLNGEEIDGVIAIDLDFVRRLLEVTGPTFLAAYNEEINTENLYERTQFHASYDYEEGSEQKRQFLTVLGSKLLESLFSIKQEATPELLKVLDESLKQRHLQINLFSSSLNGALLEKNWTGSLRKTDGDYLQVVNANLGGTKANYYVQEQIGYRVTSKTRDGLLRSELTLDYNHTGIDTSWPGGSYTNYVRVLTQKGSKLTGAKIVYDMAIEEDIFNEIIISEVEPYTSFETSFVLDPSSTVKLVLEYDLPVQLSVTKEMGDYSLVWQKQAGTTEDAFTYSFAVPFGMEVAEKTENLNQADGMLFKSGILNEDFVTSVKLK